MDFYLAGAIAGLAIEIFIETGTMVFIFILLFFYNQRTVVFEFTKTCMDFEITAKAAGNGYFYFRIGIV